MTKSFFQSLNATPQALKTKRVFNFIANARSNADMLISQKEMELRALENDLERIMDLGDDSSMSIANRISKADPLETVKKIYQLRIDIKQVSEDLATMKETRDELFPVDEHIVVPTDDDDKAE